MNSRLHLGNIQNKTSNNLQYPVMQNTSAQGEPQRAAKKIPVLRSSIQATMTVSYKRI